jgi:hypothetical protein
MKMVIGIAFFVPAVNSPTFGHLDAPRFRCTPQERFIAEQE